MKVKEFKKQLRESKGKYTGDGFLSTVISGLFLVGIASFLFRLYLLNDSHLVEAGSEDFMRNALGIGFVFLTGFIVVKRGRLFAIPVLVLAIGMTLAFDASYREQYKKDLVQKEFGTLLDQIVASDNVKLSYEMSGLKYSSITQTKEFKELLAAKEQNDVDALLKYKNVTENKKLYQIKASQKLALKNAVYKSENPVVIKAYEDMDSDNIITVFEYDNLINKYAKK